MFGKKRIVGLAAVALVTAVGTAKGVIIEPIDKGWYTQTGYHSATNVNTFTGRDGTQLYRSFFVFDLSAVTGIVTDADFRLLLEAYLSTDTEESFTVRDYVGDVADLTAGVSPSVSIFNDLGSGATYGTKTVSSSDIGTTFEIELSGAAISDINAATGGLFALGITLDSPADTASFTEAIRFSTGVQPDQPAFLHQLVLESSPPVPEPSTFLTFAGLFGMGLIACWWRRRKPSRI